MKKIVSERVEAFTVSANTLGGIICKAFYVLGLNWLDPELSELFCICSSWGNSFSGISVTISQFSTSLHPPVPGTTSCIASNLITFNDLGYISSAIAFLLIDL